MGTWNEFCSKAEGLGGQKRSDAAWAFLLPGAAEGRTQQVFVFHEVMGKDFEVIQVRSAIVPIDFVNTDAVIQTFGQLLAGAIGYTPVTDSPGLLTLSTSMPLGALDFSDPTPFFVFLHLFAAAADTVEQQVGPAGLDMT